MWGFRAVAAFAELDMPCFAGGDSVAGLAVHERCKHRKLDEDTVASLASGSGVALGIGTGVALGIGIGVALGHLTRATMADQTRLCADKLAAFNKPFAGRV